MSFIRPEPSLHVTIDDERYLRADTSFFDEPSVVADFALVPAATVSGVIRVDGSAPTRPFSVSVDYFSDTDQSWHSLAPLSYREENGQYSISRLVPNVRYRFCTGGTTYHTIEQCFRHHDRASFYVDPLYDSLTLGEGEHRDDVDFDLVSGGGISGTLHDTYRNAPLADTIIDIAFYDASGTWVGGSRGVSDADGRYRIAGVPDGTYFITGRVDDIFVDQLQLYPGIVCEEEESECPPVTQGRRLDISGGSILASIDFSFHPAVVVKGRVTDASNGQGLGGVPVYAGSGFPKAFSSTGSGDFIFYLNGRQFQIQMYTRGAQPYIDQIYPGIPCIAYFLYDCGDGAQSFSPSPGTVIEHIDFALQPGAAIAGSLYDATTSLPRLGYVSVYDADFNLVWRRFSDDSTYLTGAWYPGTYYVKAETSDDFGARWCSFYDAKPCPAGDQDPAAVMPTPIRLSAGEIRRGIDFRLGGDAIFRNGFD